MFIIVVILYSRVISLIKLSITIDVFGSKPEFGSSKNRYLGFSAMARAIATRFCIPPEISPGYRLWASSRLTLFRQKSTRFCFSSSVILVNISKGNRTLSAQVSESNKAPP